MPSNRHQRKNPAPARGQWTEKDVRNILINPVYAGVGSYPTIVPEQTYLLAVARMVDELGAAQYVAQIRSILLEQKLSVPANLPTEGAAMEIAKAVLDAVRKANPK